VIDITSTRMLGSYGFLAEVFGSFKRNKLSVDVVATSEVSLSLLRVRVRVGVWFRLSLTLT